MYAVLEDKRQDSATYECPHCGDEFSVSDVEVKDNVVYFDNTEEMYAAIATTLSIFPSVIYQDDDYDNYVYVEPAKWEIANATVDLSKLGRVQTIWYCGAGCFVDGDEYSPPDPDEESEEVWEVWKCGGCRQLFDGEGYGNNAMAAQLARGCCGG